MKIAVVGSGAAGVAAAYALSRAHEVEIFEAEPRAGGHVHTVEHGERAIDTGFIVMNEPNYPVLTRLFRELGVATRPTEMSISAACGCGAAWTSRRPASAGRLLPEILRFLRTAGDAPTDGKSLDRFLVDEGYSDSFRWHYAVPFVSALWSAPPGNALRFPAAAAIAFLSNHGMLGLRRRRWRTVVGGSRVWVQRALERSGARVRLGVPVTAVARAGGAAQVRTADGRERSYDGVVLATHAPDALALLSDPSDEERSLLGAFEVVVNETVLHHDARLLPAAAAHICSWNYRSPGCGVLAGRATVTYAMNRLQGLAGPEQWCVTLNRTQEVDPAKIVRVLRYAHPQTTFASLSARPRLAELNGPRSTAFCGAWQGDGFHEDAVASGIRAAGAFGVRWP